MCPVQSVHPGALTVEGPGPQSLGATALQLRWGIRMLLPAGRRRALRANSPRGGRRGSPGGRPVSGVGGYSLLGEQTQENHQIDDGMFAG